MVENNEVIDESNLNDISEKKNNESETQSKIVLNKIPCSFHEDFFIYHSPSRSKFDVPQELKIRESIYDFVVKLGTSLKIQSKAILAATIYINRYYMSVNISTSKYYLASAAVFISCKMTDNYRHSDKIALFCCKIKNSTHSKLIDEKSELFCRWRDQIFYREELILKSLNFDLVFQSPYDIKDDLMLLNDLHIEDTNFFKKKKLEFFNNTLVLIEIVSSLPVLTTYYTQTLFASMLCFIIYEERLLTNNETLQIPSGYLKENLNADPKTCFNCYNYIIKLLSFCNNPKFLSHNAASKRFVKIDESIFNNIFNE